MMVCAVPFFLEHQGYGPCVLSRQLPAALSCKHTTLPTYWQATKRLLFLGIALLGAVSPPAQAVPRPILSTPPKPRKHQTIHIGLGIFELRLELVVTLCYAFQTFFPSIFLGYNKEKPMDGTHEQFLRNFSHKLLKLLVMSFYLLLIQETLQYHRQNHRYLRSLVVVTCLAALIDEIDHFFCSSASLWPSDSKEAAFFDDCSLYYPIVDLFGEVGEQYIGIVKQFENDLNEDEKRFKKICGLMKKMHLHSKTVTRRQVPSKVDGRIVYGYYMKLYDLIGGINCQNLRLTTDLTEAVRQQIQQDLRAIRYMGWYRGGLWFRGLSVNWMARFFVQKVLCYNLLVYGWHWGRNYPHMRIAVALFMLSVDFFHPALWNRSLEVSSKNWYTHGLFAVGLTSLYLMIVILSIQFFSYDKNEYTYKVHGLLYLSLIAYDLWYRAHQKRRKKGQLNEELSGVLIKTTVFYIVLFLLLKMPFYRYFSGKLGRIFFKKQRLIP